MIMTCPKCQGNGKGWVDYGDSNSVGYHATICNSCGGLGYVTDNPLYDKYELIIPPTPVSSAGST